MTPRPSSWHENAAEHGLPALEQALLSLGQLGSVSPDALRDPKQWSAIVTEAVQDAFMGLAMGQGDVIRVHLTLTVQKLGKLQLIDRSLDDKVGPPLRKVWEQLTSEQPPKERIRLREFKLYLAGLTERFLVQRVAGPPKKSAIRNTAALKSQLELGALLGIPAGSKMAGCTVSLKELVALLRDAGVEVTASRAHALVLHVAGAAAGPPPREPGSRRAESSSEVHDRAEASSQETLLPYRAVERALVCSLSDAALSQLLAKRRAHRFDGPVYDGMPLAPAPSGLAIRPRSTSPSPERGAPAGQRSWRAEREAAKRRGGPTSLADPELEFVAYVSLEKRDGPRGPGGPPGAPPPSGPSLEPLPTQEPPPLTKLQWLQEVHKQSLERERLLGSSDRRELEHAWLGVGLDENAVPYRTSLGADQTVGARESAIAGGALHAAAFR